MAYVTPNYVKLNKMPDPKKEYNLSFPTLDGGLNLMELDYRISTDESPEMKNLQYREGVLSCRDGQVWSTYEQGDLDLVYVGVENSFHACYNRLWNGFMFIHEGNKINKVDRSTGQRVSVYPPDNSIDRSSFTVPGTFFPYNEKLYYKTKGYYIEIEYDEEQNKFTASDVANSAYIPVTYINCSPANGSGTVYQPENRLSASKTLWYNSAFNLTATPSNTEVSVSIESSYFRMKNNTPGTYVFTYNGSSWVLGSKSVDMLDYGMAVGGTPATGNTITVVYAFVKDYYLPIEPMSITGIKVDEADKYKESVSVNYTSLDSKYKYSISVDWYEYKKKNNPNTSTNYRFIYDYPRQGWALTTKSGSIVNLTDYGITLTSISGRPTDEDKIDLTFVKGDYYLDVGQKKVVFNDPPKVTYPETNNTVRITYYSMNEKAYNNIMDCTVADVYGGTGSLCIVMAGSSTQPNAYFWNAQTNVSMDPSYFPMTQYQLAGDVTDPITAFGKQQGYLIIFSDHSIGRTSLDTATVDERSTIDLPYVPINAKIGCDLPNSVQLIENNLVWANTDQGVHFLANTSAAYENNVLCLSQKVNTSSHTHNLGLLYYIRKAKNICSVDANDERYWLNVDGQVWVWDYQVSTYKNPAWFFFDNVNALGYVSEINQETNTSFLWHFDKYSRLTHFERCYSDYDGPIDKVYRFATQYFNTFDTYKNINSVLINTKSDTNSEIQLQYISDYEERYDPTPLVADAYLLCPRNLEKRDLVGTGIAFVYRRRPMCRRVQFFAMRMTNNTEYMDMSIVSATVYYEYLGKKR